MEMTFNDPLALLGPKNLTIKKSWIPMGQATPMGIGR